MAIEIDRREFLKIMTLAGASLLLKGCVSDPSPSDNFPPQIEKLYPELKRAGFRVESAVNIPTKSGIPTSIYNFTPYQLNEETASEIFGFLEDLTTYQPLDSPMDLMIAQLNDKEVAFVLASRQKVHKIKERVTVIVPKEAPRPSIVPPQLDRLAVTAIDLETGIALSYVKVSRVQDEFFRAEKTATTVLFATEICNQLIEPLVLYKDGTYSQNPHERNAAREVVCNSLGRAIGARMLDTPFGVYETYLKSQSGSIPTLGYYYAYMPMPEKAYNLMIARGTIIK